MVKGAGAHRVSRMLWMVFGAGADVEGEGAGARLPHAVATVLRSFGPWG